MALEIVTGVVSRSDGSTTRELRNTRTGALATAPAHGAFSEAVARGNAYAVAMQTGVTSQAGLSATTPVLTLYNPIGSGVNAFLWYAGAQVTVAVAAGMIVWLGVNTATGAAAVTGTATTTHRNLLLGKASTNQCQPLLAATLPAVPVALCSLMNAPGTLALNSQNYYPVWRLELNGQIGLAPGSAVSFQTSTASGASGLLAELAWEEVAI